MKSDLKQTAASYTNIKMIESIAEKYAYIKAITKT